MDSIIDPTNCLEIIGEMVMDGCCIREECVRNASDDLTLRPLPLDDLTPPPIDDLTQPIDDLTPTRS